MRARLGPAHDPTALFHLCQPPDVPEAPVKIRRVGSTHYVFTCESTDFRRLRQKIDHGFSQPLIHTVRGAGYMLKA